MKRATVSALLFCFVLVYLQPFRRSSTFEVCTAAKNRKKTLILSIFGGGPRSFKVIDVNTAKKLVTSDSHDTQHI